MALAEASGLTGRGGAGFPAAIKIRAVAEGRRAPVVVGNAMEGEPLSHKDAVLLNRYPQLVLDGLELVGRALRRAPGDPRGRSGDRPPDAGGRGRAPGRRGRRLTGGFVAGQETALVNQLDGRGALPRDPLTRVTTRGRRGRPTLVSNAETLAQLALAARFGADWFRSVGTPDDPGTSLFTISGAVARPGWSRPPGGPGSREVLAPAQPSEVAAVLVGGYHGAWVPAAATRHAADPVGPGAVRTPRSAPACSTSWRHTCPLRDRGRIATYLADESAAQCGPCINGLPRMADSLSRLARGSTDARLPAEIDRLRALVTGRGACAHPDGTARLVGSTMTHVRRPRGRPPGGWCPSRDGALR